LKAVLKKYCNEKGAHPLFLASRVNRRWADRICGARPDVRATAPLESAYHSHSHIRFARNLAAQSNASESACRKQAALGFGHFFWLAGNVLHPACCAAGIATASMELIDAPFIGKRQNETFS